MSSSRGRDEDAAALAAGEFRRRRGHGYRGTGGGGVDGVSAGWMILMDSGAGTTPSSAK